MENLRWLQDKSPMQQKMILGTIGTVVAQSCYWFIQVFTVSQLDLTSSWDNMIPFLPWTVTIYLFIFPYVLIVCALVHIDDFLSVLASSFLACAIAWVFFITVPASITRPNPESITNGIWRLAFTLLHYLDSTTNTCPSLHVAISWTCALGLWKQRSFWIACVIATAISISTLTTKQHFVIDVVTGFLLAVFCWLVVVKWNVFRLNGT